MFYYYSLTNLWGQYWYQYLGVRNHLTIYQMILNNINKQCWYRAFTFFFFLWQRYITPMINHFVMALAAKLRDNYSAPKWLKTCFCSFTFPHCNSLLFIRWHRHQCQYIYNELITAVITAWFIYWSSSNYNCIDNKAKCLKNKHLMVFGKGLRVV